MTHKLLIRTPNHLGDCIMAMPMINECREAYPGTHVTVLTPDYIAELFESNPAIDRVIGIPAAHLHGLIAVKKIRDIIVQDDYDTGYVLPPSFGSASAFKLAGIKERIGYIADGRRLLLTRALPYPTPLNAEHRSKVYFDLLRRATKVELEYTAPKLFLNEADDQKATALLAEFGVAGSDQYAVLACRAVAESRRWGVPNYARLAAALAERHRLRIVLIGGREDHEPGQQIVQSLNPGLVINLAGKATLRESAAVLVRARLFIGNDSGPAHLAAAVGAPLVVISGADDPKETSPIASRKRLIFLSGLACISCVKNKCPLKGEAHMQCMKGIPLDMVLQAAAELLTE